MIITIQFNIFGMFHKIPKTIEEQLLYLMSLLNISQKSEKPIKKNTCNYFHRFMPRQATPYEEEDILITSMEVLV